MNDKQGATAIESLGVCSYLSTCHMCAAASWLAGIAVLAACILWQSLVGGQHACAAFVHAQGDNDNNDNELDDLDAEANMPIEELLAK